MKYINFEIKDHSDRINMLKALQDNGYNATIITDTSYMPPKVFVHVEVSEYAIKFEE